MKKKHNFRGKLVFGTLLVFSFFVFNTDVYAEEKSKTIDGNILKYDIDDSGCDDESKIPNASDRKKCHNAAKVCDTDLTTEVSGYKIKAYLIGNKVNYSIAKTTDITVGGMKVTSDGRNIKSGDTIGTKVSTVKFSSTLQKSIYYTSSSGQKVDIKCRGNFEKYYMFDATTPPIQSKITNTACKVNEGVCWKYVNKKKVGNDKLDGTGIYSYTSMESLGKVAIKEKNGTNSYNFLEYLYKNLPYCNCSKNAEVQYKLSDSYIINKILLLAQTFQMNSAISNKIIDIKEKTVTEIKFDDDAILVDKVNQQFTCTAFGPQSFKSNGELEHPDKYEAIKDESGKAIAYNNKRKFAKKGPTKTVKYKTKKGESLDVCTVQCGEQVEVSYGPPITAKAGTCFEYIITVKSKIQCEAKILEGNKPTPPEVTTQNFDVCDVNIQCSNNTGFFKSKAGPKEEFDNCIKEKFEGKYTQKAINYCYHKVYKKTGNTKVSNNFDDIVAQKVADDSSCPWWNKTADLIKVRKGEVTSDGKKHTIQDVVDELYKYAVEEGKSSGNYIEDGKYYKYNKYKWQRNDNCYWSYYVDAYKTANDNKLTITALVNDDEIFAGPAVTGQCNSYGSNTCSQNYSARYKYYEKNTSYNEITIKDIIAHTYYYAGRTNENNHLGIKVAKYIGGQAFEGSSSAAAVNQSGIWYTNQCGENCYIYSTKANCVMPGDKTIKPDTDDTGWEEYQYNITEYNRALAECGVKAQCAEDGNNDQKFTTSKTTTYTMKANECTEINNDGVCTKHTKDAETACAIETRKGTTCDVEGAEKCKYWSQKNNKDSNSRIQVKGDGHDKSIIINDAIGYCYGDKESDYQYINSISFPGYWYDQGKNQNYINPSCKKADTIDFKKNAYCVDPDLPSINKKWAIWDQGNGKDIEPRGQITKVLTNEVDYKTMWDTTGKSYIKYIAKDSDYNIEGHFKNFGYLDWNLDFSCFYAINNTSPDQECDPNVECCDEPCPPGKKKTIQNVETKPIGLSDLFPGTDQTTKDMASTSKYEEIVPKKLNSTKSDAGNVVKVENETGSTGRTPGYNWTCEAANVKIKDPKNSSNDYIIAPVSLRTKIESAGDDVINDESELDYRITLNSDNIKEIRKLNKTKESGEGYLDFVEYKGEDAKNQYKEFKVDERNIKIKFYKSGILRNDGAKYVKTFEGKYNQCNNTKNNLDQTQCDNFTDIRKNSSCGGEK